MTTLEAAKGYLKRGFSVIPLNNKKPAIPSWKEFQERRPTVDEINQWFTDGSRNIGIVTGAISGLTVIDFDTQEAVDAAKTLNFPQGPLVKTAKGYHAYCQYEPGHRNFQKRADLPGIDLRAEGGYVVAPPSVHATGKAYVWVEGRSLDMEPPDAPEWLFAKSDKEKTPIADLYGAKTGSRNESLARLLGSWLNDHKAISLPDLMDMALLWNKGLPAPLPQDELARTCESIFGLHHRDASGTASKSIKVVDALDFMALDFPPRENILSPWLPRQGLTMVYAPRGIGKTHVSLGLAYAVTSAGTFLGWQVPAPRGVLFIDGEMPAVVLQERIAKIAASNDKEPAAPFRIYTPDMQDTGMINLSSPEDQAALQPFLEDIDLIIIDNLSTLCRTGKENEGEAWLPVQQWALQQRAAGRSVLFIHHAGKNGEQRGSSRREDVLDTVIALKHPGDYTPDMGACFEVHFEKARGLYGDDTKPFEARLMSSPDGLQTWAIKALEDSTAEKVAKLLNEGIPQHEIADLLKLSKGSVSKAKRKAANMGLLKEVS